ncbi:polyprenyl synthetase family protein [Qipengyuania aurantiaca]|uniref:Polyprenyl synthetase family protein n=2 Tax=Qipengyuania aurantiaca TaxID=2867233 RepID=A0ABX8ZQS9_9SPHN|nr:polyprenyl synthetase family protein [Qipengyuania aurantiaca]
MPDLLSDAFDQVQQDVDAAFDAYLPVPQDTRARLVEAMRYAAIGGGKRVRPLLVCATAKLFGVDRDAAVAAGCAVEAIHAYSLIHDDLPCMDDDDLRHGKPTLHKVYDEATAVLAGDCLHALAFDILTMPGISNDPFVRAELVATLAKASGHEGMAGGQMMDIVSDEEEYDIRQVTRLQQLKTGALLAASVEMGAILGKLPPEGRTHLRAYARDIGLAFQIADDLLDVEGDETKAGKALRKDEGQGKQTFVTLMGRDAARAQAEMLVEQAGQHLASYGEDARVLVELARFVVKRDH